MSDTPAGPTVDGSVVIGVPPQPSITRPGTPVYVVLGEAFRLGYEAAPAGEYYAIWNKTTGAVEKFPLTEDGWRRAWTTFAGLEPAAAAMPLPAPGIETSTETARRKLRQRLSIGGGALVAIAIALRFILPLAFGSATAPGGVLNKTVFTENFDKPSEGWVVESTSRHDARFVGGAYEIVTKNPKDDAESFKFLSDKTFASVAVQVKGTQSGGAGLWGVVCASLIDPSSNAATGYLFALIPGNQAWFMARVESSNDQPLLAQGTSSAIHATGANVLRAECRGSGAGKPTTLVVKINGTTVKTLQDSAGFQGYRGLGLLVYSDEGGTQVDFDDASLRRL